MLLLIGDGAEKSQAKSRNNQVESLGGNQTIFNEEKQTMTRQYYVGKKLLGHCTIRVFTISKNSQLFRKLDFFRHCTLQELDAFLTLQPP